MAADYVIEVNEGVVEATRQGTDFWTLHRQRFVASGLLRETVPPCVIGGKVELGPFEKYDADFGANHMIEAGMPRTAVRVKRPAGA